MRILQIVDNLAINSGVSSIIMNLYRNIDRQKIQYDFLVMQKGTSGDSYENEIKELGGRVYFVKSPLSLYTVSKSIHELKDFFNKYSDSYSVVHLHSPTAAFFTLRLAKKHKIKTRIIHSHSSMFSQNWLKSFLDSVLCLNIKHYANTFFTCSDMAGAFLYGERFMKNHHIEKIRNAINCDEYRFNNVTREEYRKELGISDQYVIGHVGNFNTIKNQLFLIDVFSRICAENDNSVLVLAGSGSTYGKAVEFVKKRKIEDKVLFLGVRSDVNKLLQCFDIFVLPSLREGLPIVAVEAQASGLPCILSGNITKEVNLGNIEYVDLIAEDWETALQRKTVNSDRNASYDRIKATAFNIENEALRVQNIYLELANREYGK